MNLKKSREGYMGGFEGRKEDEEMFSNFKNKYKLNFGSWGMFYFI